MTVSIIIPVYRTEKYITKCVQSCLNQSYHDIEIILVDDGSFDQAGKICDEFALLDSRIIVYHKKNGGISEARNFGLKYALGDLITFVDSDDYLDTTMIERMVTYQVLRDYDLVITGYNNIDGDVITPCPDLIPVDSESIDETMCVLAQKGGLYQFRTVWAKLFKTAIIKKNSLLFPEGVSYAEDFYFVLEYIKHISTCLAVNNRLYYYRLNTYDKTLQYHEDNNEYQWKNGMDIHSWYIEAFKNTGTYNKYKENVDALLLYRLKLYLNNSTVKGISIIEIAHQLKQIQNTPFYNNISTINKEKVEDPLEQLVLLMVKKKAWILVAFAFKVKNKLLK